MDPYTHPYFIPTHVSPSVHPLPWIAARDPAKRPFAAFAGCRPDPVPLKYRFHVPPEELAYKAHNDAYVARQLELYARTPRFPIRAPLPATPPVPRGILLVTVAYAIWTIVATEAGNALASLSGHYRAVARAVEYPFWRMQHRQAEAIWNLKIAVKAIRDIAVIVFEVLAFCGVMRLLFKDFFMVDQNKMQGEPAYVLKRGPAVVRCVAEQNWQP
ncbi:hypothetical protein F5Y15DRAFT_430184 [Xylariaceae sp. FL0016]|nr:hypothetical protein F5Y15DRAFT_430184 [Xylariaceae sp. FL0016]